MHRLILCLSLIALFPAPARAACADWWVTGYVKNAGGAHTADGTSVWSGEALAAAPDWVPFGTYVWVEDWGTYRVADRIGKPNGRYHLDLMVDTYAEAYRVTGTRTVCLGG